jgi:large subunit ribosomal protein L6
MLPRPVVFQKAVRCFSSTRPTHGYTSHIGRTPIPVPPSVTLNTIPTRLEVTGPLGSTSVPLEPYMHLAPAGDGVVALSVDDATQKKQRSMWGLTRTLINNAIVGMTEGFSVPLYLVGVGYRAALEEDPRGTTNGDSGKRLNMKLGFSHSVFVPIPPHIKAEVPTATKIVLSCTDKHQLGLFAAKVKKWRPPEPYKGKVLYLCFPHLGRVSSSQFSCRGFLLEPSRYESRLSKRSRPYRYPTSCVASLVIC